MTTPSLRPQPYSSSHSPLLHHGVVAVTGSATVDTGLRHNNFTPALSIKGALPALAPAHLLAWNYGTTPGTFVITVGKATDADTTTVIAASAAVDVSFLIIAGSSVAP